MEHKTAWSMTDELLVSERNEQREQYFENDPSSAWFKKYTETYEEDDLNKGILAARHAVDLMPPDDSRISFALSRLSQLLYERYHHCGSEGVLDECLKLSSRALKAPGISALEKIFLIDMLNKQAMDKMEFGDDKALVEQLLEQWEHMPPSPVAIKAVPSMRFRWRCHWARINNRWTDLDEELRRSSKEVESCDPAKRYYPMYIYAVIKGYDQRWEQTGLSDYRKHARRLGRRAIDTVPSSDETYRIIAISHAFELGLAVDETEETDPESSLANVNSAISLLLPLVELSPPAQPWMKRQHVKVVTDLGFLYARAVKLSGDVSKGEEAIAFLERLLIDLSPGDNQRPLLLKHLAAVYINLYNVVKEKDKLQASQFIASAIRIQGDAVDSTNSLDHRRTEQLIQLAYMQITLYEETKDEKHFRAAHSSWLEGAQLQSGIPRSRVYASVYAGHGCLRTKEYDKAYLLLNSALDLLSKMITRAMPVEDQQHLLTYGSGLAVEAAAAALLSRRSPYVALSALEKGRCITTDSAISLKDDVAELRDAHPGLYKEWNDSRLAMAREPMPGELKGMNNAQRLERLDQKLKETEEEIRKVGNFDTFQLPFSRQACMDLAKEGPIITYNVNLFTSGAIIVTSKNIIHVGLPSLRYDPLHSKLTTLRRLGFEDRQRKVVARRPAAERETIANILMWLWQSAVRPVLDATELTASRRVWWVTSGLMALAPIHAAGDHSKGSTANTLSRVVSSYISSLKALSYARKLTPSIHTVGDISKGSTTNTFSRFVSSYISPLNPLSFGRKLSPSMEQERRVLLVTMNHTPGHQSLNVIAEESVLQATFKGNLQILPQPSCTEVLDAMPGKSIVHMACHGHMSTTSPSSGGLILRRGAGTETLTISKIEQISIPHAEIVYLSACSTADLYPGKHLDEAITLANCFQLLGFRHVIGTIWSASDTSAGRVASAFYTRIAKESYRTNNKINAAQALHDAIVEYAADCPGEDGPLHWGPYIHVGV